eukprot:30533-Rhodomonas_salina.2
MGLTRLLGNECRPRRTRNSAAKCRMSGVNIRERVRCNPLFSQARSRISHSCVRSRSAHIPSLGLSQGFTENEI